MTSHEDAVKAAVRAALAKETTFVEAHIADATASKRPEAAAPVLKRPASKTNSPPKSPKKRKIPSKKSPSAGPDSNWKKLQKSLTKPGAMPRQKRPRKPVASLATQTNPLKAEQGANCSAFMKRLVAHTDEVSRVVAIDCEMVGVGPDGKENALARVSCVNYAGDVLYDKFVRVHEEVTDYRTKFSGIRPDDVSLENHNAVELADAQRAVGELLRGRVVVGHAIKNDLTALRLKHPWRDVRDTSVYYQKLWRRTKGRRSARPPALRLVVASVLGVDAFQKEAHDSCEDARAALMLYKRNAKTWEAELRQKGTSRKPRKPRGRSRDNEEGNELHV